ncbi:hypothetical protein J2S74_004753 [Evansella vedderi]|uniref:Uncharacterized protein n=1 Tax=Evansella vedderi TaxID=38282 RepID=A0ABU0A1E5_9BACI|nr:hypothetical protein [Evansella vedderi]
MIVEVDVSNLILGAYGEKIESPRWHPGDSRRYCFTLPNKILYLTFVALGKIILLNSKIQPFCIFVKKK